MSIFYANFGDWWLAYLVKLPSDVTWPYWLQINIGFGNGLVPSGSKPFPEPLNINSFSQLLWIITSSNCPSKYYGNLENKTSYDAIWILDIPLLSTVGDIGLFLTQQHIWDMYKLSISVLDWLIGLHVIFCQTSISGNTCNITSNN